MTNDSPTSPSRMTDEEQITCPDPSQQMERLRAIMHRLRAPGGCPWDAEQTHESLVSNLIEGSASIEETVPDFLDDTLNESEFRLEVFNMVFGCITAFIVVISLLFTGLGVMGG